MDAPLVLLLATVSTELLIGFAKILSVKYGSFVF